MEPPPLLAPHHRRPYGCDGLRLHPPDTPRTEGLNPARSPLGGVLGVSSQFERAQHEIALSFIGPNPLPPLASPQARLGS